MWPSPLEVSSMLICHRHQNLGENEKKKDFEKERHGLIVLSFLPFLFFLFSVALAWVHTLMADAMRTAASSAVPERTPVALS
jgi:hypothetical protein